MKITTPGPYYLGMNNSGRMPAGIYVVAFQGNLSTSNTASLQWSIDGVTWTDFAPTSPYKANGSDSFYACEGLLWRIYIAGSGLNVYAVVNQSIARK